MRKAKVTEAEIQDLLLDIGLSPAALGFQFITYAVQLILMDEKYLHHVTKLLYIDVAKKFQTTPAAVERNIRHCITTAWLHGSLAEIHKLFRNSINPEKGVPTNTQFLARLYFYFINNRPRKSA